MGVNDATDLNSSREKPEGIKRAVVNDGNNKGSIGKATKSNRKKGSETASVKPAPTDEKQTKTQNTIKVEEVLTETPPLGAEYVAEQEALEISIEAGAIVLALLNGAANFIFGPDAAMNELERELIEPPLNRLLRKYGITPERVGQYSDPVLLLIGFGSWGARVKRQREENAEAVKLQQNDNMPANENETGLTDEVNPDLFSNLAVDEGIFKLVQSNVS